MRFLAVSALLITALAVAPATAATDRRDDIWVGQIVRHHHHFDYRGRTCPTSAEVCIEVVANYRVVPVTRQAKAGLRRAAGGQARLVGHRAAAPNRRHDGVLYVRRVEKL